MVPVSGVFVVGIIAGADNILCNVHVCRLQDNTEANIWTFGFWALDGDFGSKWGRKILTDEYSSRIHVSCVLQRICCLLL